MAELLAKTQQTARSMGVGGSNLAMEQSWMASAAAGGAIPTALRPDAAGVGDAPRAAAPSGGDKARAADNLRNNVLDEARRTASNARAVTARDVAEAIKTDAQGGRAWRAASTGKRPLIALVRMCPLRRPAPEVSRASALSLAATAHRCTSTCTTTGHETQASSLA